MRDIVLKQTTPRISTSMSKTVLQALKEIKELTRGVDPEEVEQPTIAERFYQQPQNQVKKLDRKIADAT